MCGGHFPLTYVQIKRSQTLWVGSKLWLEGLRLDSGTFPPERRNPQVSVCERLALFGGYREGVFPVFAEDRLLQIGVFTGKEAQWVGWTMGISCPVRVHFGWGVPPLWDFEDEDTGWRWRPSSNTLVGPL